MDDLISRQAAIDAIRASTQKYTGFMEMEMYTDDDAVEAIINLPSAQPDTQWIPCSERLPDNDESVLISNSHGVTKAWWNGRFWTSIAVKKYKTVTAWMPLPEPYKDAQ